MFHVFQKYSRAFSNESSDALGVFHTTCQSNMTFSSKSGRESVQVVQLDSVNSGERAANTNPLNGRVMLIDGTSIIYRSYYKLLGMLHILMYTLFVDVIYLDRAYSSLFILSLLGCEIVT